MFVQGTKKLLLSSIPLELNSKTHNYFRQNESGATNLLLIASSGCFQILFFLISLLYKSIADRKSR